MGTVPRTEKLLWAFAAYCANGPDILLYRLGRTLPIEKLVKFLGNITSTSREDTINHVISFLDIPHTFESLIDTHQTSSTASSSATSTPIIPTPALSSTNEKIFLIQEKSRLKKLVRHAIDCWIRQIHQLENTLGISPLDLLLSSPSQNIFEKYITNHYRYHLLTPSHSLWNSHLNSLIIHTTTPPPLCLWIEGSIDSLNMLSSTSISLGIVGSRHASDNGKQYAWDLGHYATLHNIPVISGGAWGIDAAAHSGALRGSEISGCQPTIAIFAGGLNRKGPQSNATLFNAILESQGALISELPPESIPHASRFLERNRLIAALSSCICVVEASWRSGALNTARWGYDLLRPVVALPGDIDSTFSAGCNKLIASQKAQLLTSISDISSYVLPLNNSANNMYINKNAVKKKRQNSKETLKTTPKIHDYYNPLFI